ncbi:ATP-dependent helicase [Nocardia cyriacigeorgica]|uniref:ATP-dependent helicase n=1 Tax=Nocardia cyriacigeorgica TaxID=135487 RepID=A0A6P1DDP9_9NOCA|nr:UvrD-helicase domain-containing protein [Nocardia cyriacigeorgica]NEW40190.1 ATP-dependent helicase [Nocardia cyriacigeorgica]NEW47274.1 ATP-dependent helicase [Nocardia cyriacigeorgica]NEW59024.1 ATP-dependent helicase [Nocardia cyriacigeorgica]
MTDIARERRRRWVERALADLPRLTAAQRRFLSVPLSERDWHLLIDRAGDNEGRASGFAIGRTGVYALVFTDVVPSRAHLVRVRKHAEEAFAGLLFGREQFVPHMLDIVLLMTSAVVTEAHDQFIAVDESTIRTTLITGETKLSQRRAREIALSVSDRLTWYQRISTESAPTVEPVSTDGLFGESTLADDARTNGLTRPFRDWMTFLDPDQLALVHTKFSGPARFSGPAGTGKSVVALHRMAHFAKRNPGRILFTSFVRTLPNYHRHSFAHLAPHALDRTEFIGLHAWTADFLRRRHVHFYLDERLQEDAFARAWQRAREVLSKIDGTDYQYWKDELNRVIKGRGLPTRDAYRTIRRAGREGIQLHGGRRDYVWEHLYRPYQARMEERGIDDFNDIIRKAIEELRARPLDATEDFAMVVVDEVQDFTLLELQLVHHIAGGGPDANLLLVGDGQQQVYAGGWRISDAGIPLAGRGRKLRTNYRNREAVLRYTTRIEAADTVDDLDGQQGFVLRDSAAVLPGGSVTERFVARSEIDMALVRAIKDSGLPAADIAVIVNTRKEATRYQEIVERAGFPVIPLEKYDGTQLDSVKVGTVHRAKGMDFAAVFYITEKPPAAIGELTGGARDRAEVLARQTLVAVSRPRDYLWVALLTD